MKVVYFDESSAIDYLTISNHGQRSTSSKTEKTVEGSTSADVKVKSKLGKWLSVIPGIEIDGEVNLSGKVAADKLVKSSVTSAVLSDFLDSVAKSSDEIVKLEDYSLSLYKDSIEYIQSISPYLMMTNGKLDIDDGVQIEANKIYDALKLGKGYYELVGRKLNELEYSAIFRFNNSAFQHNYGISDLTSMKLVSYGVKSGDKLLSTLNFSRSFQEPTTTEPVTSLTHSLETDSKTEKKIDRSSDAVEVELPMFDIILTGIVNEQN
ncbi:MULTISPECIES: DUF6414 family protein [Lactobacillaceae]|uniref:Uncharacterized protein n=1 Tax=Lacticaseibacillus paracasei subsp. paracasei Lpp49 TaxID=1256213 RepID=A0ABC9T8W7_LACPA|nr:MULTISPECIES: DUF6414 family protein [Lactobacillaceae]MDN6037165.1 DUF6414 family protein [Lactococcus raffinolactis]EPC89133.1 hypothetical protein Lpp49_14247 [Lacticaseibacillus paracasei subsp. paracasei Lpp49]MBM6411590.1 hypothetical protein [Lacticaseibacillus paracasei]MDR7925009.1 DUF6414 family protein [Latilactobacillus sakei subsp. sakei]NYZ82874.1 hypothetical protein [Lacticaseibacillus rhamnosus]